MFDFLIGATILTMFGIDALNYWNNVYRLGMTSMIFIVLSFLGLQFLVKERR